MAKFSTEEAVAAFDDLLRNLRNCPPALLSWIVDAMMVEHGYSRDEAIRKLADLEAMTADLLEASRRLHERARYDNRR